MTQQIKRPSGSAYSPRLSAVSPVWLSVKGELGYAREITYTFQKDPTVPSLAKVCREHVKKIGYFKTLTQKVAEDPNVKKLIGGPDIKVFM